MNKNKKPKKDKDHTMPTLWLKPSRHDMHLHLTRWIDRLVVAGVKERHPEMRLVFSQDDGSPDFVEYVDRSGRFVPHLIIDNEETSRALLSLFMDKVGLNPVRLDLSQVSSKREYEAEHRLAGRVRIAAFLSVDADKKVLHVLYPGNCSHMSS